MTLTKEEIPSLLSKAAVDILAERLRQSDKEGWTIDHDDSHTDGSLALAAATYASHAGSGVALHVSPNIYQMIPATVAGWPWHKKFWKPKNPRRDLVKAGALILAEIERLDRLEKPST